MKRNHQNDNLFPMPLNKYLAQAGVCSRRAAVEKIKSGRVRVCNETVTNPAHRVQQEDTVWVEKTQILINPKPVYVLLNKPKGYICSAKDEKNRKAIYDLTTRATQQRLFSVGRLDKNTCGVLLLTNDGYLAQRLTHPSFEIQKLYHVELDKPLIDKHFRVLAEGIILEDGEIKADDIAYPDSSKKQIVGIAIHSGRNRIVRRMFEHLEYKVVKLDRVLFAGLSKKNVPRGKWRFLKEEEIIRLKYFSSDSAIFVREKRFK